MSDIILLGTEEHVHLAERAAPELVAGRAIHTHELVVSLRSFIRKALDLDPVPVNVTIPMQGPARPTQGGGRGREERRDSSGEVRGGNAGGRGGGAGLGGGLAAGGIGLGLGLGHEPEDGSH